MNRQWPAAATPRRTRLDVSPTTTRVKRLPGSVPRISENAFGDDSPVWVVATVRSELLSTAPERTGPAEVVDDSLVIEPLSRARLPIVILQPAQRRLAVRAWAGGADSGVDDWVRPIPLVAFMPTGLCASSGTPTDDAAERPDGYVDVVLLHTDDPKPTTTLKAAA